MLIQCSKCGARGNVRSEDPNKVFACPKCGGGMRAAQAASAAPSQTGSGTARRLRTGRQRPVTSRTGTSRSRTSRIAQRRRSRKKAPVLAIALGLLAIAVACGGGYYYYTLINQPGPGAQALGLLPNTTVFAASVEDLPVLSRELSELSDAESHKIRGAVDAYRRSYEVLLKDALDLKEYADAAVLLRETRAIGCGVVTTGKKAAPPALITLLVFDKPNMPAALLRSKIPVAGDISGVRLHKGNSFCVMLDNVLAISDQRELLEGMIRGSLVTGNPESLGAVPEFAAARAEYSRKGAAWFYVSANVMSAGKQVGAAVAGPDGGNAVGLAPRIRHIVGYVEVRDPAMDVKLKVAMSESDPYYAKLRIKPKALTTPEYMPGNAVFALALSLDEPTALYDRLVEEAGADERFVKGYGERLAAKVRRFERSEGRLSVASDIVPLLSGEIGVCVMPSVPGKLAMPDGALLIPTIQAAASEGTAKRLVKHLTGVEPKLVKVGGIEAWTSGPVAYMFVDDMLVVSQSPAGLKAVKKAHDSGKSLASNDAYRRAMARVPNQSTLMLYAHESAESRTSRHAGEQAWTALTSVAMNENDIAVAVAVPSLAQLLMARAPDRLAPEPPDGTPPVKTPKPLDRSAAAEKSIQRLAKICFAYRDKTGKGELFPAEFSDLITGDYIGYKNIALLKRPGDSEPKFRIGSSPTSYEVAFSVVPGYRFTKDTPAHVPMVWEGDAPHKGKRYVVYFDGSAKLETVTRAKLIRKIEEAVAKLKAAAPTVPDDSPADPPGPDEEPGKDKKDDADKIKDDLIDAL
jgi:hypothetical protein